MRRRFFVEKFEDGRALMSGEAAHHLGRVLRAQPGQLYELSDGICVRLGRIENVTRDEVEFALLEEIPSFEAAVNTVLLLSIVKFDAFEWAIEKATELGVNMIVPLAAARSEKGLIEAASKRADRWKKILVGASEQSRRRRVPNLTDVVRPAAAFSMPDIGAKILLSERSSARPLRDILSERIPQAVLAIGPEGGWIDEEFAQAAAAGFKEASMGNMILRTETAVTAALANLNFALEE